ncbi:hypothetical protein MPH_08500 [Macrophomina phaseolina MS6]|uniref:Uncharacterized protein n=1 Tax=Macrophomina phaseolina (strain MS6) TaxID=1126212 RepID=K2SBT4_MACPH|nr:hypothetical protein MPH_08500 [Macrophomina phaseolina MS6]
MTNGVAKSSCKEWPPCNYINNPFLSVNITYKTPSNALFNGSSCTYEILHSNPPSSNTTLPRGDCSDTFISTKSNIGNETDAKAYRETSNDPFVFVPFRNISNMALITAVNEVPEESQFKIDGSLEEQPMLVTSCRVD